MFRHKNGHQLFRDRQGFSWDDHAVEFRLTELPIFPGYWAAGGGEWEPVIKSFKVEVEEKEVEEKEVEEKEKKEKEENEEEEENE